MCYECFKSIGHNDCKIVKGKKSFLDFFNKGQQTLKPLGLIFLHYKDFRFLYIVLEL